MRKNLSLILIGLVWWLLVFTMVVRGQETWTWQPTPAESKDKEIREGLSGSQNAASIMVAYYASNESRGLVQFVGIRDSLDLIRVDSAFFIGHQTTAAITPVPYVYLQLLGEEWNLTTTEWANRPGMRTAQPFSADTLSGANWTIGDNAFYWRWDITSMMAVVFEEDSADYGMVWRHDSSLDDDAKVRFHSGNYTDTTAYRPQIVIYYVLAPIPYKASLVLGDSLGGNKGIVKIDSIDNVVNALESDSVAIWCDWNGAFWNGNYLDMFAFEKTFLPLTAFDDDSMYIPLDAEVGFKVFTKSNLGKEALDTFQTYVHGWPAAGGGVSEAWVREAITDTVQTLSIPTETKDILFRIDGRAGDNFTLHDKLKTSSLKGISQESHFNFADIYDGDLSVTMPACTVSFNGRMATYTARAIKLPANQDVWIIAHKDSADDSLGYMIVNPLDSTALMTKQVLLGEFRTKGNRVEIYYPQFQMSNRWDVLDSYLHVIHTDYVESGLEVTAIAGTYHLRLAEGTVYRSLHGISTDTVNTQFDTSAVGDSTLTVHWGSSSVSDTTFRTGSVPLDSVYDYTNDVKVVATVNRWYKHLVYWDGNFNLHLRLADVASERPTAALAQTEDAPLIHTDHLDHALPLYWLVVQQGAANLNGAVLTDVRRFHGFAVGGGNVSDHGLLSGLRDDDHIQYPLDSEVAAMIAESATGEFSLDSLVGYWPFDCDAKDRSGNGNDGVLITTADGVVHKTDPDSFKHGGGGYRFNYVVGVDSGHIQIPGTHSNTPTISRTLETFFMPSSFSNIAHIITDDRAYDAGYTLGAGGSLILSNVSPYSKPMVLWYDGAYHYESGTATEMNVGEFYHLAVVYDASDSTFALYQNGERKYKSSAGQTPTNGIYYTIGRHYDDTYKGGYYINGIIDEPRIYNRVLSDGEMWNSYRNSDVFNLQLTKATIDTSLVIVARDTSGVFEQIKLEEVNVDLK